MKVQKWEIQEIIFVAKSGYSSSRAHCQEFITTYFLEVARVRSVIFKFKSTRLQGGWKLERCD